MVTMTWYQVSDICKELAAVMAQQGSDMTVALSDLKQVLLLPTELPCLAC